MPSLTHHPARIAATGKHWLGPPCPTHGDALRFVSTGGCVDCGRIRSRDAARRKAALPENVRSRAERYAARAARKAADAERRARPNIADHPARLAALAVGESTWHGPDCRHGHNGMRYVAPPFACITCRRITNGKANLNGD